MAEKRWTAAEDAQLRQLYGKVPMRELCRRLRRNKSSIKNRRHKLGLRTGRYLSPEEIAAIKADYGKVPVADIARRFGRPIGRYWRAAVRLGLAEKHPGPTPQQLARIRKLNRQGLTDAEIAPKLGLSREWISELRRGLGIPVSEKGLRAAKRRGIANQRKTLGITSSGQLRALSFRRYAVENGWPEDLRPREVQILNALAARGPMTRLQLAEAIGMRTDCHQSKLLFGNGPGGLYTSTLLRRGLVVYIARRAAPTDGWRVSRAPGLYMLSFDAIAMIERRLDQCPTPPTETGTPAAMAAAQ